MLIVVIGLLITRFEGKLHSKMSLIGFGVPKFGNVLGWFWGSEIRKLLWLVLGFRNSETSLDGFGVPKFGNFFGWFWGSEIQRLAYYFRVTIVPKSRDKIEPVICS